MTNKNPEFFLNLRTKKIIARESILLISVVCITALAFILTYPYNSFLYYKINTLNKEITVSRMQADSLALNYGIYINERESARNYGSRVIWHLNNKGNKTTKTEEEFVDAIRSDYAFRSQIYLKLQEYFGEKLTITLKEFSQKFNYQLTNEDVANKNESRAIEKDIENSINKQAILKDKVLTFKERIWFAKIILLITLLLVFVLRPIFYLLKWSILTLKQKEE